MNPPDSVPNIAIVEQSFAVEDHEMPFGRRWGGEVFTLAVSAALVDDFTESDLPWRVDVVDWATTSESFRRIIERNKVVVQKMGVGV